MPTRENCSVRNGLHLVESLSSQISQEVVKDIGWTSHTDGKVLVLKTTHISYALSIVLLL